MSTPTPRRTAAPADGGQSPSRSPTSTGADKGCGGGARGRALWLPRRLKQAKSSNDTLTAMTDLQDMNTFEAGVQAAGVDRERYNLIREHLIGGGHATCRLP